MSSKNGFLSMKTEYQEEKTVHSWQH